VSRDRCTTATAMNSIKSQTAGIVSIVAALLVPS
jgi:hypothetical protein